MHQLLSAGGSTTERRVEQGAFSSAHAIIVSQYEGSRTAGFCSKPAVTRLKEPYGPINASSQTEETGKC